MMKMTIGSLALIGLTSLVGCGGGDDDGGAGEMVSVEISAADGGEVEIGEATLTIPPGALAEDTTITAETLSNDGLPDGDSLHGLAYDFGPDGTTFLMPVKLELPLDGSPGDGEEAVISWLDGDTWHDEVATVADGKVSADIMHFTTFIVRFNGVESLDCSFEACGGELVDTWDIAGVCISFEDSNPFEEFCSTATVDVVLDGSGSITFADDGSYTIEASIDGDMTVNLPSECTSSLPMCEGLLGDDEDDLSCTGDPASGCTCVQTIMEESTEMGTYETSGTALTMTPDGEDASEQQYCVDGDTLKVSFTEADNAMASFVYTATR